MPEFNYGRRNAMVKPGSWRRMNNHNQSHATTARNFDQMRYPHPQSVPPTYVSTRASLLYVGVGPYSVRKFDTEYGTEYGIPTYGGYPVSIPTPIQTTCMMIPRQIKQQPLPVCNQKQKQSDNSDNSKFVRCASNESVSSNECASNEHTDTRKKCSHHRGSRAGSKKKHQRELLAKKRDFVDAVCNLQKNNQKDVRHSLFSTELKEICLGSPNVDKINNMQRKSSFLAYDIFKGGLRSDLLLSEMMRSNSSNGEEDNDDEYFSDDYDRCLEHTVLTLLEV